MVRHVVKHREVVLDADHVLPLRGQHVTSPLAGVDQAADDLRRGQALLHVEEAAGLVLFCTIIAGEKTFSGW